MTLKKEYLTLEQHAEMPREIANKITELNKKATDCIEAIKKSEALAYNKSEPLTVEQVQLHAREELQNLYDVIIDKDHIIHKMSNQIDYFKEKIYDNANKIGELEDKISDFKIKLDLLRKPQRQKDLAKIAIHKLLADFTLEEMIALLFVATHDKKTELQKLIKNFLKENK
jgi:hypothetical protein